MTFFILQELFGCITRYYYPVFEVGCYGILALSWPLFSKIVTK